MRLRNHNSSLARCVGISSVVAALCSMQSAYAQTLAPGETITPMQELTTAPGVLLDSVSTTTSSSGFGSDALTFTARSAVFQNSAGTLDFYYQVFNSPSSADSVGRFTSSSFAGYSTDIYYQTGDSGGGGAAGFTAGTQIPITVDRSLNGGVIGFNYSPAPVGDGKLAAGQTSYTMIVHTNATQYQSGNFAVIDGVATTVKGFSPTQNSVPEPAALALMVPGLLGAVAVVRRRRAVSQT